MSNKPVNRKKGTVTIIEGNFDEFYQKHFRDPLEAELREHPGQDNGFLKPSDAKRMKVVNWKKSVKI